MLPTKLMEFIVHCSSPLNDELHFCRMIFLLSLKLCQNCCKISKLIDPFLFWTNISYMALMHCSSSHFPLHPYLSLCKASSLVIIFFLTSTAEIYKKVLTFSKLPWNLDGKYKIEVLVFCCCFQFFLPFFCPAAQATVSRACGFAGIFGGFQII